MVVDPVAILDIQLGPDLKDEEILDDSIHKNLSCNESYDLKLCTRCMPRPSTVPTKFGRPKAELHIVPIQNFL